MGVTLNHRTALRLACGVVLSPGENHLHGEDAEAFEAARAAGELAFWFELGVLTDCEREPEPVPAPEPSAELPVDVADLSVRSIKDIIEDTEDAGLVQKMLDDERAGQCRKSAVKVLEARLEQLREE